MDNRTSVLVNKSALFTLYNELRSVSNRNRLAIDPVRLNRALGLCQSSKFRSGKIQYPWAKSFKHRCSEPKRRDAICSHILCWLMLIQLKQDEEENFAQKCKKFDQ